MGVREVLGRLFSRDQPAVFAECRDCGTTTSPDTTECPACGSREIGEYRLAE